MIFEQSGALFLPMQWANHIYRDHKAQRNEWSKKWSWLVFMYAKEWSK